MFQELPAFIVLLVVQQCKMNEDWCPLLSLSLFPLLIILPLNRRSIMRILKETPTARLLTPDSLVSCTQHTHCLPPPLTNAHTPLFSVLELVLGCSPVWSAQYSTLPKITPLSSRCSPEAAHSHSQSCVTAINHLNVKRLHQRKHNTTALWLRPISSLTITWHLFLGASILLLDLHLVLSLSHSASPSVNTLLPHGCMQTPLERLWFSHLIHYPIGDTLTHLQRWEERDKHTSPFTHVH